MPQGVRAPDGGGHGRRRLGYCPRLSWGRWLWQGLWASRWIRADMQLVFRGLLAPTMCWPCARFLEIGSAGPHSREGPSCLSQLLGVPPFLGLWPCPSSLCLWGQGWSPPVSWKTLVIEFRTHPNQDELTLRSFITSAKTLFISKLKLTVSRVYNMDESLGGSPG